MNIGILQMGTIVTGKATRHGKWTLDGTDNITKRYDYITITQNDGSQVKIDNPIVYGSLEQYVEGFEHGKWYFKGRHLAAFEGKNTTEVHAQAKSWAWAFGLFIMLPFGLLFWLCGIFLMLTIVAMQSGIQVQTQSLRIIFGSFNGHFIYRFLKKNDGPLKSSIQTV